MAAKEVNQVLDQGSCRRRGEKGLNEGESCRARGATAVHRALGRGSEEGPVREQCRKVSWEQENMLAQTDASGTGGGDFSLREWGARKKGWRHTKLSSTLMYFRSAFRRKSAAFAVNSAPDHSCQGCKKVRSEKL